MTVDKLVSFLERLFFSFEYSCLTFHLVDFLLVKGRSTEMDMYLTSNKFIRRTENDIFD